MHSHFISALAFAGSASALVVPRQEDGCCFEITAAGGESGTVGQLGDGQNRVGGGHPSGSYCIKDGGITDSKGRGCILTPPTTQFQCDEGATPTTGFSVSGEGQVQYNGNSKFYACGADKDEYNIYTEPVDGQEDCVEITLSSEGKCSGNGGDESGGSSSAPASSEVASTAPASKQSTAPAESAASKPSAPASQASQSEKPSTSAPAAKPSAPSESGANSKPSVPAGTAPAPTAPAPTAPAPTAPAPAPSAPAPSAPAPSAPAPSAPSAPAPSAPAPAPSSPANSAPGNENSPCEACQPVTVTVTETAQGSCAPGASAPPSEGSAPPAESAGSSAPPGVIPGQSGGGSAPPAESAGSPGPSGAPKPSGYSPGGSSSAPAGTQPAAVPSGEGSAPPAESAGSPAPSGVITGQSDSAPKPSGYSPGGSAAPPAETQPAAATENTGKPKPVTQTSQMSQAAGTTGQAGASTKAVNEGSQAPYPTASSNKPASAPVGTGAASGTASSQKASGTSGGSACQTSLSGAYQTPHLIVPVSSEQPDEAYGTNYNGQINSTTSTIFNFDIPQDYEGKQCSIIFLFPKQEDLETSDYEFGGSGSLGCSELSDAASEKTSFSSVPSVESDLGSIELQPGNSYVVATQDCKAGTTQSIELSSKDGLDLNFFEDWNPSPLGLYITSC